MKINKEISIKVFLSLVSLHSFFVGVGLIILPQYFFDYLGFGFIGERFFSTQGGVFHILMAICYAFSAIDLKQYKALIFFSIIIKFSAAIFLFIYFLFINGLLLIAFSGISDLIMGAVILYLYLGLVKGKYFGSIK
jgi:hypothetical protein